MDRVTMRAIVCRAAEIADCADLAIVPTFRLDCRRGKGFVVP